MLPQTYLLPLLAPLALSMPIDKIDETIVHRQGKGVQSHKLNTPDNGNP